MTIEKIKKIMPEVENCINHSRVNLPKKLRIKVAEEILNIMASRQKHFGLFVIVGWQDKWNIYTDISDSQQDIFGKHNMNIMEGITSQDEIATTIDFDGAILIDGDGIIKHSGVIIEGLRPRVIADKVHPGHFHDLSEQFGFKGKVHTRHLSAITSSYIFKGTTVMTVSEETNSFHVFEGGKIAFRMYDN